VSLSFKQVLDLSSSAIFVLEVLTRLMTVGGRIAGRLSQGSSFRDDIEHGMWNSRSNISGNSFNSPILLAV